MDIYTTKHNTVKTKSDCYCISTKKYETNVNYCTGIFIVQKKYLKYMLKYVNWREVFLLHAIKLNSDGLSRRQIANSFTSQQIYFVKIYIEC